MKAQAMKQSVLSPLSTGTVRANSYENGWPQAALPLS
jgi:hypothetical protein